MDTARCSCYAHAMKMIGKAYRQCDSKACTCNPASHRERTNVKRAAKRRERRQWKMEN